MPTEDGFPPDDPLPLFLSGHADEHEERGSLLLLNASILVLVASLVGMAIILSWGNPVKVFADVTASLTNISALQPGTDQSTPTIPSAPTVQSAADAQASPPTARDAPSRDEIAAAFKTAVQSEIRQPPPEALFKQFQTWAAEEETRDASKPADQSQTEISEPPAEALLKQFQAWAAEEDTRAQVVQPVQDAQAQVVQDAPAQVRPMQKHRHVRLEQNARAEIRPERNRQARVRREQNAGLQVRPAQGAPAPAPDQSVQNAQAPSFLQSFGRRN